MSSDTTRLSSDNPTSRPATRGPVIVITGGSSGIGLCTALLFARRGWQVGLVARGARALESAATQVQDAGAAVATAEADVADPRQIERAADAIAARIGQPDVWVNCAGTSFYARFQDMTEDEFRRVMDVTFMGQVHGTRAALARMGTRGGTIVHVGSVAAYRGLPLQTAYVSAKFALRGFVETLRTELMHDRVPVHLSIVHPPSVNTPFFLHAGARMPAGHETENPRPVPPVYQPEVIADAIWLAVAERRREIKVSGTAVNFALMNTLMPEMMDRMAALTGFAAQRSARDDVAAARDPSFDQPPRNGGKVHGLWDRESRGTSTQMWAQRNRTALGLGAIGLMAAARAIGPRRR